MAQTPLTDAKPCSVPGKVVVWMDALRRVAHKIMDKPIKEIVITALERFERAVIQHNAMCEDVATPLPQLRENLTHQLLLPIRRVEATLRQCQADEDSFKTATAIFAKINKEVKKGSKLLNAAVPASPLSF